MARGPHDPHPPRTQAKAFRALAKAGCDKEALRLIVSHVGEEFAEGEARTKKLSDLAEFVTAIGAPAARDYFRAITETTAVGALTDERLLRFARSIDRHTAEWYFWAIWGTKAVPELTSERVLQAVEFFRSIDSPATVEYFLAIRETKAAGPLTDERVLDFAQSIGSEAAVEYFGAFWETKAVRGLIDERVLGFAEQLGGEAAQEYFRAIRETRAVAALTDPRVLASLVSLGKKVAVDYFRAVRTTKAAAQLTSENVLLFAEVIGKGPAREYFRAIASTKEVGLLTGEGVLRASGVIRSIGDEAALDYFLAIAATKVVPTPPGTDANGPSPTGPPAVPVLTLLDIPTYDGYRSVGLLGVSAVFWWYAWQASHVPLSPWGGLADLGLVVGVWVGLLCGAYLLLGAIAQRSTEEFLRRRRRLLNEHGIRWHDCLAADQRCELCWSAGHHHEDRRFDYGAFCRCPAC